MKWLKIFAWIVFPYIMILFAWKRFGVVKRTTGVLWAFFILIVTIIPKDATPETITTTNTTPETATIQTTTSEPKALKSSVSAEAKATAKETAKAATPTTEPAPVAETDEQHDVVLEFPVAKYPKTAAHIAAAIEAGQPAVCTIDRNGADANRDASLAGLATKAGHDRDEWPMAMCDEGGAGADIAYVPSSENRGSGSWVGHQLRDYSDGTKVLFVLDGETTGKVVATEKEAPAAAPAKEPAKATTPAPEKKPAVEKTPAVAMPAPNPQPKPEPKPTPAPVIVEVEPEPELVQEVYFKNCSAVRAAGADPILRGEPGYAKHLDRDGDGIGCE